MYLKIVSDTWEETSSEYWQASSFSSAEEAKGIIENFAPTMENAIRNSIMNILGLIEKKNMPQVSVHVTSVRHNYGSSVYNILITTNHAYLLEKTIERIKHIIGDKRSAFVAELFEVDENIEYYGGRRITQQY